MQHERAPAAAVANHPVERHSHGHYQIRARLRDPLQRRNDAEHCRRVLHSCFDVHRCAVVASSKVALHAVGTDAGQDLREVTDEAFAHYPPESRRRKQSASRRSPQQSVPAALPLQSRACISASGTAACVRRRTVANFYHDVQFDVDKIAQCTLARLSDSGEHQPSKSPPRPHSPSGTELKR